MKILISELISEHPDTMESQIVKLVFGTGKPDHQYQEGGEDTSSSY